MDAYDKTLQLVEKIISSSRTPEPLNEVASTPEFFDAVNEIMELGCDFNSSIAQLNNGTLAFNHMNFSGEYLVFRTGYIRRYDGARATVINPTIKSGGTRVYDKRPEDYVWLLQNLRPKIAKKL
jgi:hypothetical protein